jgi:hypothetical protein
VDLLSKLAVQEPIVHVVKCRTANATVLLKYEHWRARLAGSLFLYRRPKTEIRVSETNAICSRFFSEQIDADSFKSPSMISIYFKLFVATVAILAVSFMPVGNGSSTGALNCPAGGAAIAAAGAPHASGGTTGKTGENGPLSKRGTTFAINGVTVKGGESYNAKTILKWTLKTTDVTYGMRGILIRVAFTGGDSFTMDSTLLKDNRYCTGIGVSGLTHKDTTVKKTISGNMRFDKPGSVTVDITVVYCNGGVKPNLASVNGYSQYKFTIKAPPPIRPPVRPPVRVLI